jgi:hypothetical protein
MPKKTTHTRGNVQQRHKPKAQKSFELVRPISVEDEIENKDDDDFELEITDLSESEKVTAPSSRTKKEATASPKSDRPSAPKSEKAPVLKTVEENEPAEVVEEKVTAPRSSASARIAARRQAGQKTQRAVSLISAQNYSYVRKDLIFIAILAIIMFSAIIVLHFVPAIGG